MNDAWYFTRDGKQAGPVEWNELQKLATHNKLMADDHVWTEGFTEWKPASSVPDLFKTPEAPAKAIATSASTTTEAMTPMAAASSSVVSVIDYNAFAGPRLAFAGFSVRFLAGLIDGLIILTIGIGLMLAFTWYIGAEAARANASSVRNFVNLAFIVVSWVYCASLESGPNRSTLGKRLLGLKVTDLSGNQISFGRATGRHFGKILSQLIFFIGYLMMKLMPRNQCLHDLMAGCVVMREEWH